MNTATLHASEAQEQEQLFLWAAYMSNQYNELELMYHVPNGGKRNALEAKHLKRQGVKAGVPDIVLPVARGEYHGLYIELKVGTNRPTDKQRIWLERLQEQGYYVAVCYGSNQAAEVIVRYLELEKEKT